MGDIFVFYNKIKTILLTAKYSWKGKAWVQLTCNKTHLINITYTAIRTSHALS